MFDKVNINQANINTFLNKYISFVDNLSDELKYDNNIRHLLYLIVPSFIIKYGINNESGVLNTFKKVKIYIRNSDDQFVTASFNRVLKKDDEYYTDKFVMINEFSNSTLPGIIDNIVHEFNHAINSIKNEIIIDENYIKLRSGIATLNYDKEEIFVEKSSTYALEEVLNTIQTEDIINIIKSLSSYNIENSELSNLIDVINSETGNKDFVSDAYYFQKNICKKLVNNKSFTNTFNNLRFKGNIENVDELFDNVVGVSGKFNELNTLLSKMHILIIKYSDSKFLKKLYLNKIKSLVKEVNRIITDYENKSIIK